MCKEPKRLLRHWRTPIILILITVLAAFLRFWQLDAIPPGFHYDEALEALEAWRVWHWPGYHPVFFPGDFGLPAMFIYLDTLAFRLFGYTPAVARGVAAAIGTLTVPALYALGREWTRADDQIPPAMPLLAAAVLAISRWHITFSRIAIESGLVPLFLVLVFWALFRGLRTNSWGTWLGLGCALGLSVYTYPAAWLLSPLVIGYLVYLGLLALGRLRGRWRGLLLAGVIAFLLTLPLGLHFWQHPEQLTMRSGQVAITSASGSTPETLLLLGGNLLRSLGLFSFTGDIDARNNVPGMPALDLLIAIPFYLGLALALWQWKRPAFGGLLLMGGAMMAPTVFSQYAPHFRRAIGLIPVIALLSGLGLAMLWGRRGAGPVTAPEGVPWRLRQGGASDVDTAAGMDRLRRLGRGVVVAAILLGSGILSTTTYFVKWARSPGLYYAYDQGLWEIANYVRDLPADEALYISPRPAKDATLAFAWREGPRTRHFDGRHAFVAPTSGAATWIVIEHEDFRGGRLLRELYPGASEARVFLDRDGNVYARAFSVADAATLARGPRYAASSRWPGIALVGYDLNQPTYRPGEIVYLQLWWHATAKVQTDWTVFTHLLGPVKADGSSVWAGQDARPGQGSTPTTTWTPGDLILDEYQLQLPADVPSGVYQIEMGLYDPAAGGARAQTSNPPGQDHLIVGTVAIE